MLDDERFQMTETKKQFCPDCDGGILRECSRGVDVGEDGKSMTKLLMKCTLCEKEFESLDQWRVNRKRYVAAVGYYE